jgi:hypothetical protein
VARIRFSKPAPVWNQKAAAPIPIEGFAWLARGVAVSVVT